MTTQPDRSDCLWPRLSVSRAQRKGCKCEACRAYYNGRRRLWRAANGPAVEREREAARRWKREHLGQPGLPKGAAQ